MTITTEFLSRLPFNHLETDLKELTPEQVIELQRNAEADIQRLARLAGYLSARGADGCGDHGHSEGLKRGEKLLKKVRKALGYTSP